MKYVFIFLFAACSSQVPFKDCERSFDYKNTGVGFAMHGGFFDKYDGGRVFYSIYRTHDEYKAPTEFFTGTAFSTNEEDEMRVLEKDSCELKHLYFIYLNNSHDSGIRKFYDDNSSRQVVAVDTNNRLRIVRRTKTGIIINWTPEFDSIINALVYFKSYFRMAHGEWVTREDSNVNTRLPDIDVRVVPYEIMVKNGVMVDTVRKANLGSRNRGDTISWGVTNLFAWPVYTYPERKKGF